MIYTDHYDDSGYRVSVFDDDLATLHTFAAWLDQHGIKYDYEGSGDFDDAKNADAGVDSIMTEWITDKGKAALLKLTWGGTI